jgi:cytochrome c553
MRALWFLAFYCLITGKAQAEISPLLIKLNCQTCHHSLLASSKLLQKKPEQILSILKNFKTGRRPSLIMHRLVKGLTDEELRQVALLIGLRHGD